MEVGKVVQILVSWTHRDVSTPADFIWELWAKDAANHRTLFDTCNELYLLPFYFSSELQRKYLRCKQMDQLHKADLYPGKPLHLKFWGHRLSATTKALQLSTARHKEPVVEPDSTVTRPRTDMGGQLLQWMATTSSLPLPGNCTQCLRFSCGKGQGNGTFEGCCLSAQLTLYTAQSTTLIDSEPRKLNSRVRGPGHGLGNILQFVYLAWNKAQLYFASDIFQCHWQALNFQLVIEIIPPLPWQPITLLYKGVQILVERLSSAHAFH